MISEISNKTDSPGSKLKLRDDDLPKDDYRHPWMQEKEYEMEDEEQEEFEKHPLGSRYY